MLVVFPYSPGDQELAEKLSAWMAELGKNVGHSALIARDVRCHPNIDRSIKYNLEHCFDAVEVIDIVEKIDGWPVSPNNIFRTVAKHIQYTNPQPWFWCEPDIVPLRAGWIEDLDKEYKTEPRKPFLGDFVKVPDVIPHMSGVACYPGRVVDYAGDAVMAREIAWDCYGADQIVPNMKQTRFIAHRWKHPPFKNQSEVDNLLSQLPTDCCVFHQDKSGTLIEFLRERMAGSDKSQSLNHSIVLTGSNPVPATLSPAGNKNDSTSTPRAGIGTVDIFIKTYPKDYVWLNYCLKSIDKFAGGFRNVVVISPSEVDMDLPKRFVPKVKVLNEYGGNDRNNDNYLSQQVFKLYADTFTDADWILHTDSDTIFTRPITPQSYLKNGKFVWMYSPIEQVHPNDAHEWRAVMRKFLGKTPEFEFMRRHPFLFPRWLYSALRAFCVRKHGVELHEYIMSQPYRAFSEFNVIGFFAFEYFRDEFEWVHTSQVPEKDWPTLTVDQRWSLGGLTEEIKTKWEQILSSGCNVYSTKAGGSNPQHREMDDATVNGESSRKTSAAQTTLASGVASQGGVREASVERIGNGAGSCVVPDTPNPPFELETMAGVRGAVTLIARYADKDGFARMRVRKELKRQGVIR